MSLLSSNFFVFFVLVLLANALFPARLRIFLLLAASYLFYGWKNPLHLGLLIAATAVDYLLARCMERWSAQQQRRKWLLGLGVSLNLAVLLGCKYLTILWTALAAWHSDSAAAPSLLLPLGISYYTCRKISYLFEVYRGHLPAEKNIFRLALYVAFFPEMAAGPIDRPADLLRQFPARPAWDKEKIQAGLFRILCGLWKKLVIADRLALLVKPILAQPTAQPAPAVLLSVFLYAVQIYCDFSALADLAIGLGKILGYDLAENFRQPYFARSIGEFWQRWHITLSTWLRDYLFLPLCYHLLRRLDKRPRLAARADTWAYLAGATVTMTLCGLWHEARWTFLLWGLLHGLYLSFSQLSRRLRQSCCRWLRLRRHPRLHSWLRLLVTFHLLCFAWIFFQAANLGQAWAVISRLPAGYLGLLSGKLATKKLGGIFNLPELSLALLAILFLFGAELLYRKRKAAAPGKALPGWLRWSAVGLVLFSLLLFGRFNPTEFIYVIF